MNDCIVLITENTTACCLIQASSAEDNASAKANRKWSLILSVSAIIFGVVGLAIVMGVVFGYYYPTYFPNVVHGTSGNDVLFG